VALGIVLLVSAGLMLRTLAHFTGMNAGYDGHNVLTASISLQDARYNTSAKVNSLFDTVLGRIRELPGVQSAGVGLTLPYERALNNGIRVADGPHARTDFRATNVTYVTPGYFEALRMTLVIGRLLSESDRADSRPVAVVNEAFVRRFFAGDSPIGWHLNQGGKTPVEIVGVVGDVPEVGFTVPLGPLPNVYTPASQQTDRSFQLVHTWFSPAWVIRTAGPQGSAAAAMTAAVTSADTQLPIAKFRTMDEVRAKALALQRLEAILLGTLAALALLLVTIGVYGLVANSVTQRTREFGIRLALGSSVVRAISGAAASGVLLAAIGAAVGCLLAVLARNLLKAIVFGVPPTDILTYVSVLVVLLIVACIASLVPSLRIARIDPATTLREE
jgi:predicted permease